MPAPSLDRLRRRMSRAADPAAGAAPAPPPSRLAAGQQALLARMREDNERAGHPFAATSYRRILNARFDAWLHDDGIEDATAQAFNAFFSAPSPKSGKYHTYAVTLLYRHVLARDTEGLLDRVRLEPVRKVTVEIGPHCVSWDLLISLDTLYALAELVPGVLDEPVVVADLGSGWGRIGHVLALANPRAVYCALDLPESLLIAATELPRRLPGRAVAPYDETRAAARFTREELLRGPPLRFHGPQDLARFEPGAVDVLLNVASFQEMTRAQVTDYLQLAGRVARAVYLQERRQAPRADEGVEVLGGWAEYDVPPAWRRAFLRETVFSADYFEAGFLTAHAA